MGKKIFYAENICLSKPMYNVYIIVVTYYVIYLRNNIKTKDRKKER